MAPTLLVASFEDAIEMVIGLGLVVVIPLIAILTAHQRRMAEIIHRNQGGVDSNAEVIARLRPWARRGSVRMWATWALRRSLPPMPD